MMCLAGPARGCAGGDRGRPFRTGSRRLRITAHHRRGAGAQDLPAPAQPPRHRPGYRLRDRTVHTAAARPAARRLAAGRQRRLGGHAGTAQRRRPRPRPRGGPAAGSRRTAAVAGRQPRCGHRVQLRSPLRPRPLPDRRRPGAEARRPAVHLHPHPAAERANDLGPILPGLHRARAAPAHPGRDPGRRQPNRRAHHDHGPDLRPSAHQHRQAAPGPGRRTPLLNLLPLHPRRAAHLHHGLPGPPAQHRSPLGRRAPPDRRQRKPPPRRSLTARAAGRPGRSRVRPEHPERPLGFGRDGQPAGPGLASGRRLLAYWLLASPSH